MEKHWETARQFVGGGRRDSLRKGRSTVKLCLNCGELESDHTLYVVDESVIERRSYDIDRGPLCPGQLEDLDCFDAGEDTAASSAPAEIS
jgi:hypothetical protein